MGKILIGFICKYYALRSNSSSVYYTRFGGKKASNYLTYYIINTVCMYVCGVAMIGFRASSYDEPGQRNSGCGVENRRHSLRRVHVERIDGECAVGLHRHVGLR